MLKGILQDQEFQLHDEIEEVITMAWNDFTFDEVQNVFHNWMNRLGWIIENWGSPLLNNNGSTYFCLLSDGIGGGPGTSFPPVFPVGELIPNSVNLNPSSLMLRTNQE
jgi:hypothetical protein